MSSRLNWTCLLIGLLLFCIFAVHFVSHTPDDIWISMRYAEHFAHGQGLVFNPGERVEGYSNFLWVMLLSAVAGFTTKAGLTLAAKFLGIGAGLVSLLILAIAARKWPPAPGAEDYWGLAPLAYGLYVYPAFWSASGMETGLNLLLIAFGTSSYFHFARTKKAAGALGACFGFLAAALTHPESILFFFAVIAAEGSIALRDRKRPASIMILAAVLVAALYLAFFFWRHWYYGQWWPNTFFAKGTGGPGQYVEGVRYLLLNLPNLFWSNPILAAILLLPFLRLKTLSRAIAFVGIGALLQLTFSFGAGGDWMPASRFLAPIMPLAPLLLPVAIVELKKRLSVKEPFEKIGTGILVLVFLLAASIHLYRAKQEYQAPPGVKLTIENFYKPDHHAVAVWLMDHAAPGDLIALGEAGLIPFLTDLPALDLFGLADFHIARIPGLRHEKFDADYCFSRKPKYIILGGCKIWNDQATSDFHYARVLLADKRLEELYRRAYTWHTFLVYEAIGF